MKKGYLSEYFKGVACKRLSSVEAHPESSNQHEFDGVASLKKILGGERLEKIPTRFIYLGKDEQDSCSDEGFLTWYDARERHPTRSEYRLYFNGTDVSECMAAGDLMVLGTRYDGSILVIVTLAGSTYESQIIWLFGLEGGTLPGFDIHRIENEHDIPLGFSARSILEEIGIEVETADENWLDRILENYAGFPSTSEFSLFARKTLGGLAAQDDPDSALIAWLEQEEMLFRTLERYLVEKRLKTGFSDVDEFTGYALGILNRRKSRAGHAFENHLEQIFLDNSLLYSRGAITENRAKPDFIFPAAKYYHDTGFPAELLTMLGVKSTCKDRWRQVLSEAARIENKHLVTLEPGISEHQTNEMQAHRLRLVVPQHIQETYHKGQREWLMCLRDFIVMAREKQETPGIRPKTGKVQLSLF